MKREKKREDKADRVREGRDFYRVVRAVRAPAPPTHSVEDDSAENLVAKAVVNAAYELHTELGPGLLERVYEVVLAHELRQLGYAVARQVSIPIAYRGIRFEEGYVADLIVADAVIVELKSVEGLLPVHAKTVAHPT